MPITIADLSRLALYLNAITSWVLLAKILSIRLHRFYPVIAIVMLLDVTSASLFSMLGPDSRIVSDYSRYMSLPYAVLYVFAATEIFKELHCQRQGLRSLTKRSIFKWQLVGIFIAASALLLDQNRWGTRGFDCLTFIWMEGLRCTSAGLTGFILGSFRQIKALRLRPSSTTKFLTAWLIGETLPNGLVLWIGMAFFPYNSLYIDVCNIVCCTLWSILGVASVWWLKRPDLTPSAVIPLPDDVPIFSFKRTVDRLLSPHSGRQ